MKLINYIKKRFKGSQLAFAERYEMHAPHVSRMLNEGSTRFVFTYKDDNGDKVTSIFIEKKELERVKK